MAEADSSTNKRYDFVVFGASGFTGQFVVEELARGSKEEGFPTWALAGRNMGKMVSVLKDASKQTGTDLEVIPIIIADVKDESSLDEMCKQAKVVLNCVGPYRFFGEQVVRACIKNKASHVDISGEPQFLERMQLMYNEQAKEAGVYVVGSCGFDSIPAEMGVLYTQNKFDGDLNSIESYLSIRTGPEGSVGHYATWQSAVHGFAHAHELVDIRKQLYPTPLPKPKHRLARRPMVFKSKEVKGWCVPFPGSDRSVINRTQRYSHEVNKERPLQFHAYVRLPSMFATMILMFVGVVFGLMAKFSFGRSLLEKYPKIFSLGMFTHEGPTRTQRAGTSFSMTFYGKGYSTKVQDPEQQHEEKPDKSIITKVTGPEPGYVATPIFLIQSALVLVQEQDKLPKSGGVFTPCSAFAKTSLIERLQKNNIKFEVL